MSTIQDKQPPEKSRHRLVIGCLVAMLIAASVMLNRLSHRPQGSSDSSMNESSELSIEDEIDLALAEKRRIDNPDNVLIFGSDAQDAKELRGQYASAYDRARALKLMMQTRCEGCGKTEGQLAISGGHLETHHVISVLRIFTEDLEPELVADSSNLIVLCRNGKYNCHFTIGHDPDGPNKPLPPNWKESNKNVRKDAAKRLATLAL